MKTKLNKSNKWRMPSEKSIRQLAAALGVYGADRRPARELYKVINNQLANSWQR